MERVKGGANGIYDWRKGKLIIGEYGDRGLFYINSQFFGTACCRILFISVILLDFFAKRVHVFYGVQLLGKRWLLWKITGRRGFRALPRVPGATRSWISAFFPCTIINPSAWNAKKRRRHGPIMKRFPKAWSDSAWRRSSSSTETLGATAFTTFIPLRAKNDWEYQN